MMTGKVLLLSGDGAGPSLMQSVETVLKAVTDEVEVLYGNIGRKAYEETGHYLPHDTLDLLDECKYIICGPTIKPDNGISPVETLSVQLDLFARVRSFRTLAPGLGRKGMNVLLWGSNNIASKEITEVPDLDGVTLSKYIKNDAYGRMMELAAERVTSAGIGHVTCLTRDDFFPVTSGMFSETFAEKFPAESFETEVVNVREWTVDTVSGARNDRCIICVDLYRQIVGGVLGGLTGHDHLCPRALLGTEYSLYQPFDEVLDPEGVMYEDPTPAILSMANILDFMGMKEQSKNIDDAVLRTYADGDTMADVGGELDIQHFTQSIIAHL